MSKGQVSVEFMIILSVLLLYISVLILPNAQLAMDSSGEVAGLGQARLAAEKITDTANLVSLSGANAKQTIKVFVPKYATVKCNGIETPDMSYAEISFEFSHPNIQDDRYPLLECNELNTAGEKMCTRAFNTVSGPLAECIDFPLISSTEGSTYTIEIEKHSDPEPNITIAAVFGA